MQHEPTTSRYLELLGRGDHASELGERLEAAVARERLYWAGGNAIARVLQPYFMARSHAERCLREAAHVHSAIVKMTRRVVNSRSLRAELGLDTLGNRFACVMDGRRVERGTMLSRLDGFFSDEGQLRFVEYNPGPAGYMFSQLVSQEFAASRVVRSLASELDLSWFASGDAAADALTRRHQALFGENRPISIAVVPPQGVEDPRTLETENETSRLGDALELRGAEVLLTSWDAFEVHRGRLYAEDREVTFVLGDLGVPLRASGPGHPVVLSIYRGIAAMLANLSFWGLSGAKSLFAALTDPVLATGLDLDERRAIRSCLPWTRVLSESRTEFRGRSRPVVDIAREHRESMVLKANSGLGGRDVWLGWSCSEAEWEGAIEVGLRRKSLVLQERISVPRGRFPVWRDGAKTEEERFLSFDPFVFYPGEPYNAWVRSSTQQVINLTQGGDFLPLCLVDGV